MFQVSLLFLSDQCIPFPTDSVSWHVIWSPWLASQGGAASFSEDKLLQHRESGCYAERWWLQKHTFYLLPSAFSRFFIQVTFLCPKSLEHCFYATASKVTASSLPVPVLSFKPRTPWEFNLLTGNFSSLLLCPGSPPLLGKWVELTLQYPAHLFSKISHSCPCVLQCWRKADGVCP